MSEAVLFFGFMSYVLGVGVTCFWCARRMHKVEESQKLLLREVNQLTRIMVSQIGKDDEARKALSDNLDRLTTSRQNVILPLEVVVRAMRNLGQAGITLSGAPDTKKVLSREERWLNGEVPSFMEPVVESLVTQAQAEIANGFEDYEEVRDV